MKIKSLFFNLLILATIFSLFACNSSSKKTNEESAPLNEVKIKPNKLAIGGAYGQYLSVIDGTYTFFVDTIKGSYEIKVKIKNFKKFEEPATGYLFTVESGLKLDFTDNSGIPISGLPALIFKEDYSEKMKFDDIVKTEGDYVINFSGDTNEKSEIKLILSKLKSINSFIVTSTGQIYLYKDKK